MDGRRFDNATRAAASAPHRRALLTLGGAGLAAAMTGGSGASAAKKTRKTCKKQKKQCRQAVQSFCAQFGGDVQDCLEDVLPCCASCKVKSGVLCVLNIAV